eukprot:1565023-Heterocapsa_arctica.AAC.1
MDTGTLHGRPTSLGLIPAGSGDEGARVPTLLPVTTEGEAHLPSLALDNAEKQGAEWGRRSPCTEHDDELTTSDQDS